MKKNKAVFFDRDGVINRDNNYYTFKIEDFIVNDGIFEALRLLCDNNYLLFVITNQSGIAKGEYSNEDVNQVHEYFKKLCAQKLIEIQELYHCPHHPDYGNCICRKPDSLLIEKAIAAFNIDATQSYFIGDRSRDIEAASKCNLTSFLVEPNENVLPIVKKILITVN